MGQLHRRRADPARGGVNEHRLAGLDPGPLVQSEPRQVEGEVDGGRRGVGQRGCRRHFERHGGRTGRHLRVATEGAARYGDHPLPDPLLGAGAGVLDGAQHLHARRVGERRVTVR